MTTAPIVTAYDELKAEALEWGWTDNIDDCLTWQEWKRGKVTVSIYYTYAGTVSSAVRSGGGHYETLGRRTAAKRSILLSWLANHPLEGEK